MTDDFHAWLAEQEGATISLHDRVLLEIKAQCQEAHEKDDFDALPTRCSLVEALRAPRETVRGIVVALEDAGLINIIKTVVPHKIVLAE